jgi:phosphoglycolate phosphatase-like HAD superfamily hydrolase
MARPRNTVLFDLDGVCLDFTAGMRAWHNARFADLHIPENPAVYSYGLPQERITAFIDADTGHLPLVDEGMPAVVAALQAAGNRVVAVSAHPARPARLLNLLRHRLDFDEVHLGVADKAPYMGAHVAAFVDDFPSDAALAAAAAAGVAVHAPARWRYVHARVEADPAFAATVQLYETSAQLADRLLRGAHAT